METNSIFVKDNATSGKKLQNLWQGTTSNSVGQVEIVFARHSRNIWNLDGPWEFEILPGTSQAKQKTSKMVFEATRLQLHTTTHSGKNKYQNRHSFKKRSSQYKRR